MRGLAARDLSDFIGDVWAGSDFAIKGLDCSADPGAVFASSPFLFC